MTRNIFDIALVILVPGILFSIETGKRMLITWPYHLLFKGVRWEPPR